MNPPTFLARLGDRMYWTLADIVQGIKVYPEPPEPKPKRKGTYYVVWNDSNSPGGSILFDTKGNIRCQTSTRKASRT